MTSTPVSTAARRIARESRDHWTTHFDAEGHSVASVYDTTGKVSGPKLSEYAVKSVGKMSQGRAQAYLDALAALEEQGVTGAAATDEAPGIVDEWLDADDSGRPRETVPGIFAARKRLYADLDAEEARFYRAQGE